MKKQKVRFITAGLIIGAPGLTEQLGKGYYNWAGFIPTLFYLRKKEIHQN